MPVVTLLTDFGTRDYYVAALKGVLASLAPEAMLVDLSHEIAPGDIVGAGFLLRAAAPEFPPDTIHLAVVDPGVGSNRRILAVRSPRGTYVAPDNGLLTGLFRSAQTRSVIKSGLFREGSGSTFHGRDRFAPVAGHLASGGDFEGLGPLIADPVRIDPAPPRRGKSRLEGRVVHIDRFGNLITDIPTEWLGTAAFTATIGPHKTRRIATHYAEIPAGEPSLLAGSLGTLEISIPGASLAELWQTGVGAPVLVEFEPVRASTEVSR